MSDTLISTMRQEKTIFRKRLPPEARDKLAGVERDFEDAAALSKGAYEKQEELHVEKDEAMREKQRVEQADESFCRSGHGLFVVSRDDLGGGNFKITKRRDLVRLEAARETWCTAQEAFERQQRVFAARSEAWKAAGQLIRSIGEFLEAQPPGAVLEMHPAGRATPDKNESVAAAIARVRATRDELVNGLEAIEAAPVPSGDRKKMAAAYVHDLAANDPPTIGGYREGNLNIRYPHMPISISTISVGAEGEGLQGQGSARIPDAVALLAWLMPREFTAALIRDIDLFADDENALTGEQRASQIAKARALILACERQEESLIEQADGQVARRFDARPIVVLGLADGPAPVRETAA